MGKSFIYLLFTKSNTLMSKAVSALTSDEYTHVSVCVDENLSDFYSFGRRRPCFMLPAGFTKESVYGGLYLRDESIPCKLVRIQTDEKKVDRAKAILDFFYAHRFQYKYSIIGTILCRVGITYHRDHHRFCSQFVSEVLRQSQALELPKDSVLMRPSDFLQLSGLRCLYCGLLKDLPQRQRMQLGEPVSMTTVYFHLMMAAARRSWQRMR